MNNQNAKLNVLYQVNRDEASIIKPIVAGEILLRINKDDRPITKKVEFFSRIFSCKDKSNIFALQELQNWIKDELDDVEDNKLFQTLNYIRKISSQDLIIWLNSKVKHSRIERRIQSSKIDRLAMKLALVKRTDTILDPTSGCEGAWLDILRENKNQQVTIQEINPVLAGIAYLNGKLIKANNLNILVGDVLNDPKYIEDGQLKQFDKVISFPPISMIINSEVINQNSFNRFRYGKIPRRGDYAFISNAISSIADNGKAVLLVADGPLFQSGLAAKIRKNLIDLDLVEAVVSLPSKFLLGTAIPVNLLILNRNKGAFKGKIQFIEADQNGWYEKVLRNFNQLTPLGIEKIVSLYQNKVDQSGVSRVIKNSEYKDTLSVKRYVWPTSIEIDQTTYSISQQNLMDAKMINLGELVEIKRGYNVIRRNENGDTTLALIKITDIDDLVVKNKALSEISISSNPDRYLVRKNDVLFSIRGTLGKIAYVDKSLGNAIANANMVILRPKNNNTNMKWLALYLNSPLGKFFIQQAAGGTTISIISPTDLEQLKVPVIAREKQDKAVEKLEQEKLSLDKQKQELMRKYIQNDNEFFNSWGMDKILHKED
ncbi:N-6 DNA methylase [Lactobacillus kefiranofaciens]|uniref:site-specific DNA-methyltransferase (adenine-specific) n=1 Tax=Lactobacillus kefiranofaciens TaxID=267818 RepID=A0AAX3UCB3_9LACO|nr:N-6 DNA methylase [Lactobacillus kefiranofaciens]AEG41255.1 N-6 DNA methylase [Lactobacillus kefiranofaciens subsp. kefiranofaciens]KRM21536.1 N-6 DNA methylase [Lactobacillus kefiranofaciens subsp. kefiranofaciens DSM 5016 = JCM 6985]QFQ68816.1 N-6 DNA methylase [Lactobacillus kefiranofaciens subsp. kefiranofaciens]WGO85311.1 N-6 DNA methylase [Lactobacillus kefiranofaciens]WQH35412.1 N-6 DNA methylase [Lactobacillus kefiranofaciens]